MDCHRYEPVQAAVTKAQDERTTARGGGQRDEGRSRGGCLQGRVMHRELVEVAENLAKAPEAGSEVPENKVCSGCC